MDAEGYRSREEMIALAEAHGFGKPGLRHLFESWQKPKYGLLGLGMRNSGRRNERLWHPIQAAIWLAILRHQELGVRLSRLAGFPVGLWLLGLEGVDTEQAQRALAYWVKDVGRPGRTVINSGIPDGPGSYRARGLQWAVDRMASPMAKESDKRILRTHLEAVMNSLPKVGIPTRDFVSGVAGILSPGPKPTANAVDFAEGAQDALRLRCLAVEHISTLCSTHPEIKAYWEWARRMHLGAFVQMQKEAPAIRAQNADIGWLFGEIDLAWCVEEGCNLAVEVLGFGLDVLLNHRLKGGSPPPDPVPDIRRWLTKRGQ